MNVIMISSWITTKFSTSRKKLSSLVKHTLPKDIHPQCKNQNHNLDAKTNMSEGSTDLFRHGTVSEQIFFKNHRASRTTTWPEKKHTPYVWGPEHSQAFDNIKKDIVQAPILKYYDPKKETLLQTDASIKGLIIYLLLDGHPVYFTSKSLQDAERGYVAINLEALAVVWSVEKFHHFLCACHFTLETDQKPLETILTKTLIEGTPWLQWLTVLYFPIWLQSMIYKRFYQTVSRLPIQTWMPKGQDPIAQTENACYHQTTASNSQQIK